MKLCMWQLWHITRYYNLTTLTHGSLQILPYLITTLQAYMLQIFSSNIINLLWFFAYYNITKIKTWLIDHRPALFVTILQYYKNTPYYRLLLLYLTILQHYHMYLVYFHNLRTLQYYNITKIPVSINVSLTHCSKGVLQSLQHYRDYNFVSVFLDLSFQSILQIFLTNPCNYKDYRG